MRGIGEMKHATPERSASVETWQLSLFVAGRDAATESTIMGLEQFCAKHLPGRCTIEVVDIVKEPERADDFEIIAIPTLIRQKPLPQRRIIGDLSLSAKLLAGLGIRVDEEGQRG